MKKTQKTNQGTEAKKFKMEPQDQVIFWGCIDGECKSLSYQQQNRIVELYYFLNPLLRKTAPPKEPPSRRGLESETSAPNYLKAGLIVLVIVIVVLVIGYFSS